MKPNKIQEKNIQDFGEQWSKYRNNEGYYGSKELFADIVLPLLNPDEIRNCKVADIGSGTGRIVNMLLEYGARQVIALEPSNGFEVLKQNISSPEKVICLKVTGEQLPATGDLDYVFSIGVLHQIPDPKPVVNAVFAALRPGGRFICWIYGEEGNELYLSVIRPLRLLTKLLPHNVLAALVWCLDWPLRFYMMLCRNFPLPLRKYLISHLSKFSPEKRRLVIYDQLNPSYAKYYTRKEAKGLLVDAKFEDVQLYHRHGYSWTVIGTKPNLKKHKLGIS
jgi:SAM-dependent methyltransferase